MPERRLISVKKTDRTVVAVLMPVRDGARSVQRAVESVLCSTFAGWELIVVDDGSQDDTCEIVSRLAGRDSRIRLLRQRPLGLSAALNRGLQKTAAPFIARVDSDDLSDPEKLELQVRFMEQNPQIGVVGTRIRIEPPPVRGAGMKRYVEWQNGLLTHDSMFRERFVESPLAHATALFRREVLTEIGGWPDGPWAEDMDLWLRLFSGSVRFAKLPQVLYTWRIRPQSVSWNDPRCSREMLRQCKIHYLKCGPLNRARGVELWGVGRSLEAWASDLRKASVPLVRVRTVNPKTVASESLPRPSGQTAVACYTSFRVRERLRRVASKSGWTEGVDLLMVA